MDFFLSITLLRIFQTGGYSNSELPDMTENEILAGQRWIFNKIQLEKTFNHSTYNESIESSLKVYKFVSLQKIPYPKYSKRRWVTLIQTIVWETSGDNTHTTTKSKFRASISV